MTNSTSSSPWPKRPADAALRAPRCGRRARRRSSCVDTISVPGVAGRPVAVLEQARQAAEHAGVDRRRGAGARRRRRGPRSGRASAAVRGRHGVTLFSSTPVSAAQLLPDRVVDQQVDDDRVARIAARRETRPRAPAGACRSPDRRRAARRCAYAQHAGEAGAVDPGRQRSAAARRAPTARPSRLRTPAAATARRRADVAARRDRPARRRSTRPGYSPAALACRRVEDAGDVAAAGALDLERGRSARGSAPARLSARSRLCTRYELKLKNSRNPHSRKNATISSAGTKPMKMYERISLRRTRHSRRRFASTISWNDEVRGADGERERRRRCRRRRGTRGTRAEREADAAQTASLSATPMTIARPGQRARAARRRTPSAAMRSARRRA